MLGSSFLKNYWATAAKFRAVIFALFYFLHCYHPCHVTVSVRHSPVNTGFFDKSNVPFIFRDILINNSINTIFFLNYNHKTVIILPKYSYATPPVVPNIGTVSALSILIFLAKILISLELDFVSEIKKNPVWSLHNLLIFQTVEAVSLPTIPHNLDLHHTWSQTHNPINWQALIYHYS